MEQRLPTGTPDIFALGAWFSTLVGPLLDYFADPSLGPALAFLILVLGLVAAVAFLVRVRLIRWRLAHLQRVLHTIPDAAAFGLRFGEVASAFRNERLTAHGWSELKDSFVWPIREGEPIANTARPGRYLNRYEAGLHYRRVQSLPNLFVGLGLLFTFIGLVAALKAANSGIASGDIAATTNSLAKLLGAATAKFYTSIAGLTCSIVLGFVIRHGLARIDHSFAVLAAMLEERLVAATPESLASRLLEEAREQSAQLKLINTDIAVAIGRQLRDAIDEALPRHLAAAATPLTEQVSAMMETISSQGRAGVGEMIKAFGDRLEGATQDRMGEIAETLARLATALDATVHRMSEGGDDVGKALKEAAGGLVVTVQAVHDTVAGLTERLRSESETSQERVADRLAHMDATMAQMAERLIGAVEEGTSRARQGAGEAASILVAQVTAAAERLESVASSIESAIARASERAQAAVRDTAEDTARQLGSAGAEAVAELRGAVGAVGNRLGELGEELLQTMQSLRELEARIAGHARAIGDAEGGTRAVVGALGETAIRIRTAAGEASDGIRGATQPLVLVSDRLSQTTEAARRSNEGLERVLTEAATQAERVLMETASQARRQAEAAEKALDQLQTVWERHVRHFDGVDQQLGNAFNEIGDKLRENLGHLAKFSAEIDGHTSKAVGQFAGAIEDLMEVGVEISKGVQAMNGHTIGARR